MAETAIEVVFKEEMERHWFADEDARDDYLRWLREAVEAAKPYLRQEWEEELLSDGVEALARCLWEDDAVDEGDMRWDELDEWSGGESRRAAQRYLKVALSREAE